MYRSVLLENAPKCIGLLRWIQNILLDIGSDFASSKSTGNSPSPEDVQKLEVIIDTFDAQTPKLTEFILPGVGKNDANLHMCRAICRRLERHIWVLNEQDEELNVNDQIGVFVNRLSDFFFAFARFCSEGREYTRSQAKKIVIDSEGKYCK